MKQINKGDIIRDHKAKISYVVTDIADIENSNKVIIAEVHLAPKSPCTGYDVIILPSTGIIPESELWGEKAWSYCTADQAKKAHAEICLKRAV